MNLYKNIKDVFACFSACSAVNQSRRCFLLIFILYIVFVIAIKDVYALCGRKESSKKPLIILALIELIFGVKLLYA